MGRPSRCLKTCASRTSTARRSSNPDDPLYVKETSKPFVRELCGNAFQKTPVTTDRRARGCASFCGFYRQESVAVGAWRGLITQRSLVHPGIGRRRAWFQHKLLRGFGSRSGGATLAPSEIKSTADKLDLGQGLYDDAGGRMTAPTACLGKSRCLLDQNRPKLFASASARV